MIKTGLLLSTALAGSLVAGVALADDGAQPTAKPIVVAQVAPAARASAAASQDNLIAEVIVTAEKRSASLQTVPVAISAFTAEKRDLIGITSVVDQTNYTPGLTYTPGNDRLSLRGVGRLTNVHAADSGTAIYTDGVFLTSATQAGRSPLFIERTEILRGPQGTLYGRNAIGGTFNLISKRPTREFSGEARLGIGDYDVYRFDGTVSVPITDNLRTRFNFTRSYQGEGFQHNLCCGFTSDAGQRNENYYEAQLEGEVGKLDFWLQWTKNVWHDDAPPGISSGGSFAPPDTTLGTGALVSPSFGFSSGLNLVNRGTIRGNPVLATGDLRAQEHDRQFNDTLHANNGTILHLTYHLPSFDLKYIGGWAHYHYQWRNDGDGTAIQSFQVPLNPAAPPITTVGGRPVNCFQLQAFGACAPATVSFAGNQTTYDELEEYYSHEINIASTWDGPLQFIGGLYFYHEKGSNPVVAYAPTTPQLATPILASGAAAAPNPDRIYAYSNNYFGITSRAIFGQVDYKLTNTIKLTAGLRYTSDEKKAVEEERFVYYGSTALGAFSVANAGTLAPAIDITTNALGAPTALTLAQQGGVQQGVVGPLSYDPATGRYKRPLRDGSNAATGTAGVEWQPDRRTLVYAKYSRGYKAFAFYATQLPAAFSSIPYSKPEFMDNVEVGLKKDWTRRFQTNVTAFYDLYYDAQVPLSIQQGANPAFTLLYNVPRSVLQGVELEATWAPINRLNVLFTYAYLDAHVTKACCVADPQDPTATQPGAQPAGISSQGAIDAITGLPTRGQDLKGQQLPFSPKNKLAINVNYTLPLGVYGDLIGSASYLWRDEQYSSFFNREYNRAPSRDQVDLRVTYKEPKNRFELVVYARNVFDNTDFESLSGTRTSTGAIYSNYSLTDPRTVGGELRVRF